MKYNGISLQNAYIDGIFALIGKYYFMITYNFILFKVRETLGARRLWNSQKTLPYPLKPPSS